MNLSFHQTSFIADFAIVLLFAGLVAILFQKIRQPVVLGYLFAGILIGPHTPPFALIDDEKAIRLLADLGIIFLMFSVGLEFHLRKLYKVGLPAIVISFIEVIGMLILGFYVGRMMGWTNNAAFLLGAALSISSTTIIVKALEELNLKNFYFAELMIGVLLIEDLIAILLLVFIPNFFSQDDLLFFELLYEGGKLFLVIASWFLLGYLTIPYLMRSIQRYINSETLTILSVGLCLFLSTIALYFNYSIALGAFIMGCILAETIQVKRIEALTLPVRDIFAAVFFVSVGMLIDPLLIIAYFPYVLLLSFVTIGGKILTTALGSLVAGQTPSNAIRMGFGMAQIGEFSFIIAAIGLYLIPQGQLLYSLVVAVSAVTTLLTPYLIKWSIPVSSYLEKNIPATVQNKLYAYSHLVVRREKKEKLVHEITLFRFFINVIIVAILLGLAITFFVPIPLEYTENAQVLQVLLWSLSLILASPFLWALYFSEKWGWTTALMPVLVTVEVAFFISPFLSTVWLIFPIFAIIATFFALFYDLIKKTYLFLETVFITNLTYFETTIPEDLPELMPVGYEVSQLRVMFDFPFIERSLKDSRFPKTFGITIIGINRDNKMIWLPTAAEKIFVGDELLILGSKEQIERFKNL